MVSQKLLAGCVAWKLSFLETLTNESEKNYACLSVMFTASDNESLENNALCLSVFLSPQTTIADRDFPFWAVVTIHEMMASIQMALSTTPLLLEDWMVNGELNETKTLFRCKAGAGRWGVVVVNLISTCHPICGPVQVK